MIYRGRMMKGVAVLDVPANLPDGTPVKIDVAEQASESWQNTDIEALISKQRVDVVRSLEELAGDWPAEDSVEELIALVREARS
jgi:hypothetical protein